MITGCLQQKNNTYYAVLYVKLDGKRKNKWIPTGLPVEGTSQRKSQKAFDQIRLEYEQAQEEKERQEAEEARELIESKRKRQADVPFMDYLKKWLLQAKPTISKTTFKGYRTMLDGRVNRYFTELDITVGEVTPQHLQDFYQTIFDEGHTPNTVIHYHAVLRKALQNAVKKDILNSLTYGQ